MSTVLWDSSLAGGGEKDADMPTKKRTTSRGGTARISKLEEKLEEHHKALFGNGTPGMDENIRNILKELQEDRDRREIIFKATVGAAISSLIMLLVNGVIYFAKIMPVLERLAP